MESASELLERSATEYELRSLAADDQAVAGDDDARLLALAWKVVAIALREVAAAIESERRAA